MLVAFACTTVLFAAACMAAPGQTGAESARDEVARAEEAVATARARGALWTTARDALRDAKASLAAGDNDAAVRAARFAAQQAMLGLEQLSYPRYPE
jgi:ABC-type phosphate transport system ATPase subunit